MNVVSDASPIISLALVHQLTLIPQLYGSIMIPALVHQELLAGAGQDDVAIPAMADWLQLQAVADLDLAKVLRVTLGGGEGEAIALALERKADLLLVDDHKARTLALRLDLRCAGTLDILIAAKRHGFIAAVQPVLDNLMDKARFRVSRSLYRKTLELVNEITLT